MRLENELLYARSDDLLFKNWLLKIIKKIATLGSKSRPTKRAP